MTEWENYKIPTTAFGSQDAQAQKLLTVRHVAHVHTAHSIISDGKIRSGLVYDESKLNSSRLSVVWLSANTWAYGSIYGTVEFQFSWVDILSDRKIYWVESIAHYRPPAYRFILSRKNLPAGLIQAYDPATDNGPLRLIGGEWFWNGKFTSEFMIDDDLELSSMIGLDFISHRKDYCRLRGYDCKEGNIIPFMTAGKILAYVLSHGRETLDKYLSPSSPQSKKRHDLLDTAYSGLWFGLTGKTTFGGPLRNPSSCEAAVNGALALYATDRAAEAQALLSLIASEQHMSRGLRKIIRRHFGMSNWQHQRQ